MSRGRSTHVDYLLIDEVLFYQIILLTINLMSTANVISDVVGGILEGRRMLDWSRTCVRAVVRCDTEKGGERTESGIR